ncbi:MAG TPA: PQQ-binding-like beta-propeller repeat protein, partial [Solirubrobacteraceae bacterium]|nr:PQQ-binding-like beta-propeller repeat protein [Solirubrobacteraceae bacterium]
WTITSDPQHEHVWGALTLLDGVVYVELASYCDIPPYRGRVISIDPGRNAIRRWFVTGRTGPYGGGIWGWGGLSAESGALYVATGNSVGGTYRDAGYAEHVVRLTRDLRVSASNYPGLPSGDADFGATPLPFHAHGCPAQLAVGDKYGPFFVYDRDHIGSGPVQRLSLGGAPPNQHALLGLGAYWAAHRLLYVANPAPAGPYHAGILAFRVTRHCRLSLAWQAPEPAHLTSSPSLANGVLFYDTGVTGKVKALDARTGKRLWSSRLGASAFNAPSVANGAVYVGAWDRRLHAFTLG